jgi:hypothetical protein
MATNFRLRSGGLADAHLPAHLIYRRAQLRLLQRKGNLVFTELALLHGMRSFSSDQNHAGNSVTKRYCLLGQGQHRNDRYGRIFAGCSNYRPWPIVRADRATSIAPSAGGFEPGQTYRSRSRRSIGEKNNVQRARSSMAVTHPPIPSPRKNPKPLAACHSAFPHHREPPSEWKMPPLARTRRCGRPSFARYGAAASRAK